MKTFLENKKFKKHSILFENKKDTSILEGDRFDVLKKQFPRGTVVEIVQVYVPFKIETTAPATVLDYLENKCFYGEETRFKIKEYILISLAQYNSRFLSDIKSIAYEKGLRIPLEIDSNLNFDYCLKGTIKAGDFKNIANLNLTENPFIVCVKATVCEEKLIESSQETYFLLNSEKDTQEFISSNSVLFELITKEFYETPKSNTVLSKTTDWIVKKGDKTYSQCEISHLFKLNFNIKEKYPFYNKQFHSYAEISLFESYWNIDRTQRISAVMASSNKKLKSGYLLYNRLILNELILNNPLVFCLDSVYSPTVAGLERVRLDKNEDYLDYSESFEIDLNILEHLRVSKQFEKEDFSLNSILTCLVLQLAQGNLQSEIEVQEKFKIANAVESYLNLDIAINNFFIDYILDFYCQQNCCSQVLSALKEFSTEGAFNSYFVQKSNTGVSKINVFEFKTELDVNLPFIKPHFIAGVNCLLGLTEIVCKLQKEELNLIALEMSKIQRRLTPDSLDVFNKLIQFSCQSDTNHILVYLNEKTKFDFENNCFQKFMSKTDLNDLDVLVDNWKVPPSEVVSSLEIEDNEYWFKKKEMFPFIVKCEYDKFEKVLTDNSFYIQQALNLQYPENQSVLEIILDLSKNARRTIYG